MMSLTRQVCEERSVVTRTSVTSPLLAFAESTQSGSGSLVALFTISVRDRPVTDPVAILRGSGHESMFVVAGHKYGHSPSSNR